MDPTKFDELTKALATSPSRRQALKTIAATTLAGLLGLSGIGTAFAKKCKPNGQPCGNNKQCCGGACCNHKCTDLSNDVNNCGSCGHVCASGQICQNGTCCTPAGGACTFPGNCCPGLFCSFPGAGHCYF